MGLRRQALRERNSRLGPYNGNNGNNGTKAGDYGPSPWDVPNRLLCPRDAWYPPVEAQ